MNLTEGQEAVLAADGHLLVTGGPGSGKTTVSILKASRAVAAVLGAGQKVLFLSFARATVSRVEEAIGSESRISAERKRRIDVETYHSFFWRVIKAHGYLIGLPRRIRILTPTAEAIALSGIRSGFKASPSAAEKKRRAATEAAEKDRLAFVEGLVCFDLFAALVRRILGGSARIRRLVGTMYPVVVLDEFQDTNGDQWDVVLALGSSATLVALADPEQRIYDWIGADPLRLQQFRDTFAPLEVDLGTANHRSAGTDIGAFGNDLLTGRFRTGAYAGVTVKTFAPYPDTAMSALITSTYEARKRLAAAAVADWSLAILVPTRKMTRLVSDALRTPPGGMAAIQHFAVVEQEAAILGAAVLAHPMQPGAEDTHLGENVLLLRDYYRGRGADTPGKGDLDEAGTIVGAYEDMVSRQSSGRAMRRGSRMAATLDAYREVRQVALTGDPDRDWRAVRQVLESGGCARFLKVAEDVRNLRLLERGTQFRQGLAADWRDNGAYRNALAVTRQAFVQEHFSSTTRPERGVVVMNMHKAKGKQFDEVIVFEGWPVIVRGKIMANPHRFVRGNETANAHDQARQGLRVAVTRGKRQATVLTPSSDPCVLFR